MVTLPIAAMRMPSDLRGVTNGNVPRELLGDCGVASLQMHHLAARAMRAMVAAVTADIGVRVWATSTLRTFERQVAAFDGSDPRRWDSATDGRYVPEVSWAAFAATGRRWATPEDVRSWRGARWRRRAGTAMSAVPGTSNHGWGLAIDFAERDERGGVVGVSTRFVGWLVANAQRFGFSAEAQSEPWHWRYVAGDQLPAAVLAWEAGQEVTPRPPQPQPTEEDDMRLIRVDGDMAVLLLGSDLRCRWLSPDVHAALRDAALVGPQVTVVQRAALKAFELHGPAPIYGAGQAGATRPGDFARWVP